LILELDSSLYSQDMLFDKLFMWNMLNFTFVLYLPMIYPRYGSVGTNVPEENNLESIETENE